MSNPGPEHIAAAKRILRYLKGTKGQKLTYMSQPPETANRLICYADSVVLSERQDGKVRETGAEFAASSEESGVKKVFDHLPAENLWEVNHDVCQRRIVSCINRGRVLEFSR
eukprot:2948471-Rhodomonas_salina.1